MPIGFCSEHLFGTVFCSEREGFEPSVRKSSYNGLAISRFRPLSHLSFFLNFTTEEQTNPNASPSNYACRTAPRKWRNAEPKLAKKKNHPGTKLKFPARLPTSLSTSSEFHSQVRDGLAWFH